MDYLEILPPPPLDRVVHRFWFLRTGEDAESSGIQTIVPDGRVEIVLHLGEPFAEVDASGRARRQGRALVAGQLTAPYRLASRPGADVIGIRLRTGAAQRLLACLRPTSPDGWCLSPTLSAASSRACWTRCEVRPRPAAARRGLPPRSAACVSHGSGGPVEAAVALLEPAAPAPIGALARSVGLTPRTLQRRFQAEVGMDPTLLRRILRFRAAFHMLERLPPGRWGRVAPRVGYFDQAHLIREFRRFAGAPPSVFFGAGPELARAFSGGEPAE